MADSLPIIGYENLLESGTVTNDGSDPANAYDWLTYDVWTTGAASGYLEVDIGSSTACDYLAIAGHTIDEQTGDCKLQYWTGAAFADVPGSAFTPSDGSPHMVVFPSVSATKYKFVCSNLDAAAMLAVVSFGSRLELERGAQAGFISPQFARSETILNAIAHSGATLGSSVIRKGVKGTLPLAHLSEAWVRQYLDGFLTHARTKGWFLLWNHDARPNEVLYGFPMVPARPSFEAPGLMKATITYEGIIE